MFAIVKTLWFAIANIEGNDMHRRTLRGLAAAGALAAAIAALAPLPASAAPSAEGDPGSLMLVLDASGSMGESLPAGGGTKIAAAKAAMHDVIGGLPTQQEVGLRVFGAKQSKSSGRACTDSQRIADLATGNRPALDSAVDAIRPFGETPIGYALQQAGRDLGADGQRTVVLVSDGEPTCDPDPCEVAAGLAKDGVSLRIDVVGLDVSGKARDALKCIADRGRGHYYDADSADDLSNALDTTATRAAQPFGETGTPVKGTTVVQGAPLIGAGDWLDRLGSAQSDDKTHHYRLRRAVAGSTLHVSADSVLRGSNDYLSLRVVGPDGRTCGDDTASAITPGIDPILLSSVSFPDSLDASEASCATAGDYDVQVTHGLQNVAAGNTTVIPVEIRVREEAPIRAVESLPEAVDTPDFTQLDLSVAPKAAVGGQSLASATAIRPGAISGTLVPGEIQAFAVDVGWGQSLAAEARASISPALGRSLTGGPTTRLSVKILSPSRDDARGSSDYASKDYTSGRVRGSTVLYSTSDGDSVYEFANGVAYRNRFSTDSTYRAASEAGRYLVVVSLLTDKGAPRQYAVPFTMATAVRGDVAGAPTYTAGGTSGDVGTTATTPPTTQPKGSGSGGGSDRADGSRPVDVFQPVRQVVGYGALGLGGLAVLAGAVVLVVLLLRRRAQDG